MFRAIIILAVLSVSASAETLDRYRLLMALRQVEAGDRWDVPDGPHGERGPWQITAAVWSQHCPGRDFAEARQSPPAFFCARDHIEWLRAQLRAAGADDNAFNIALAWNAGLARVLAGRAPISSYDYARRVRNLYLNP